MTSMTGGLHAYLRLTNAVSGSANARSRSMPAIAPPRTWYEAQPSQAGCAAIRRCLLSSCDTITFKWIALFSTTVHTRSRTYLVCLWLSIHCSVSSLCPYRNPDLLMAVVYRSRLALIVGLPMRACSPRQAVVILYTTTVDDHASFVAKSLSTKCLENLLVS